MDPTNGFFILIAAREKEFILKLLVAANIDQVTYAALSAFMYTSLASG